MDALLRLLFPLRPDDARTSALLLAARVIFGGLLLTHGVAKWSGADALAATFPDPLGVGSGLSLGLAIFAEVFCAAAFVAGLLYRLALLPMLFTMGVAFFAVHAGDPFAAREPALLYLAVFALLFAAGPGRFAADRPLARRVAARGRAGQRKGNGRIS